MAGGTSIHTLKRSLNAAATAWWLAMVLSPRPSFIVSIAFTPASSACATAASTESGSVEEAVEGAVEEVVVEVGLCEAGAEPAEADATSWPTPAPPFTASAPLGDGAIARLHISARSPSACTSVANVAAAPSSAPSLPTAHVDAMFLERYIDRIDEICLDSDSYTSGACPTEIVPARAHITDWCTALRILQSNPARTLPQSTSDRTLVLTLQTTLGASTTGSGVVWCATTAQCSTHTHAWVRRGTTAWLD